MTPLMLLRHEVEKRRDEHTRSSSRSTMTSRGHYAT